MSGILPTCLCLLLSVYEGLCAIYLHGSLIYLLALHTSDLCRRYKATLYSFASWQNRLFFGGGGGWP